MLNITKSLNLERTHQLLIDMLNTKSSFKLDNVYSLTALYLYNVSGIFSDFKIIAFSKLQSSLFIENNNL